MASSLWRAKEEEIWDNSEIRRYQKSTEPLISREKILPLPAFLLAVPLGGGGLVDNGEEERRLAMGLVINMKD